MSTAIQLKKVTKKYGALVALDGISVTINKGEIFGIVGPNGAGKTTLIEIIEGLRESDSGEVTVLGMNIRTESQQIKQRIGVLLQSTSIPERARVREVIQLFSSLYERRANLDEVIQLLNLESRMNQTIKSLSGGWKQRVSLALALIHDPDIVFLDEPSMGLDPNARHDMWQLILKLRKEGRTIIVTTHYMEEAETLCDRVAIIDKGKLVALDTPGQLITKLGDRRRASFKLLEPMNHDSLPALVGVTSVTSEADRVYIESEDMDQTLKHLFRLAEEEHWIVSDLRLQNASMNDVFNELTLNRGGGAQ